MNKTMNDFLHFKKMITPIIIRIIFWVSASLCVLAGLVSIVRGISSDYGGGAMVFSGLLFIALGPVLVRVYCELLIVIFTINDTLTDIKNHLKKED